MNNKYAIYCPFYITNNNGNWINKWLNSVAKIENCDFYYSISYPTDYTKWDVANESSQLTTKQHVDTIIHALDLGKGKLLFNEANVEHPTALKLAHEKLLLDGYDYMVHIEQDVIINTPIANDIVNECVINNKNFAITDIASISLYNNVYDLDISIFCINLHKYTSTNYKAFFSDSISLSNDIITSLHNKNITTFNELISDHSVDILLQAYKSLAYEIYQSDMVWDNYKKSDMVSNTIYKTPIFLDISRSICIHAFLRNDLLIHKINKKAIHVHESRNTSTYTHGYNINEILKYYNYIPKPLKHLPVRISSETINALNIVIVTKNQSKSIVEMIHALNFYMPSIKKIFVLDRCTDDSVNVVKEYNELYIERTEAVGFCAGSSRNLGLTMTDPHSDVLFLDGDRIPSNISMPQVLRALYNFDITLLKCNQDSRTWFTDNLTYNPNYGTYDNSVWTCGFVIRREAINAIKKVSGDLFNIAFDGTWGHEDTNMGDVAYHIGLSCGGFPNTITLKGNTTVAINDDKFNEQTELRHRIRSNLRFISESVNERHTHSHTNHNDSDDSNTSIREKFFERRNILKKP